MRYILRHKNIDVALLELEPAGFDVRGIEVLADGHFPLGVRRESEALRAWWKFRNIPSDRSGVSAILRDNNLSGVDELALGSFGLNLSDQYWIVPESKAGFSWDELNFFDNDFSDEAGKVFGALKSVQGMALPDHATSGQLIKRWVIEDGTRYLIKGATYPNLLEAYSEKAGSVICRHLGINHAHYEVVIDKLLKYKILREEGYPASKCACLVGRDTELIHAENVIRLAEIDGRESYYERCLKGFEALGVADARRRIDEMIVVDYLLANTDRHEYNFGAIRNADTLGEVSFAPLFDFGNSMLYAEDDRLVAFPFCRTQKEQIGLVSDFSWYEPERLKPAIEEVEGVMAENRHTRGGELAAQEAVEGLKGKVASLGRIAAQKNLEGKYYLGARGGGGDDGQ